MYELIRGRSKYVIAKSESIEAKNPPPPTTGWPAEPLDQEIEKATWKEYVLSGSSRREPIKRTVADSWDRCLGMGVDPALGKCLDIRPETELGAEYRLLKGLVEETYKEIYRPISGKGLLVTVCDRRGYLVSMCGDYKTLLSADRLNFGPGANWSERSVGTNAIGTALTTGRPMRVAGREHFCESHHGWICSAAPIFDLNGGTIGCIDISGPKTADHTHALALAVEGARAIENRLYRIQSFNLVSTIFNAVMTGLVYIDLAGTIRAANQTAAILLETSAGQLVGMDARQWFDLRVLMDSTAPHSGGCIRQGLTIRCCSKSVSDVRALPILSPNQTLAGTLLVLCERQQVRPAASCKSVPHDAFGVIIGHSAGIRQALDKARRVASTPCTVLITGQSGTGKEVIARALHNASPRNNQPFVAINCGAIPPELIQSELFGYVEGAFTGAGRGGSAGKFEQATGGSLFLDEIGEMPLSMQVNLLRVLDEKKIVRVGGKSPVAVDVRIIAATHQDLETMVAQGRFRQDLFYRLNVVCIPLPPLCQRGNDIELLASWFISKIAGEFNRQVRDVDPGVYSCLMAHSWPGNVRELRHALESAITMMEGDVLRREHLPERIRAGNPAPSLTKQSIFNLEAIEQQTIQRAYAQMRGNISRMSKALGIGRNTLYAKLKKIDLA